MISGNFRFLNIVTMAACLLACHSCKSINEITDPQGCGPIGVCLCNRECNFLTISNEADYPFVGVETGETMMFRHSMNEEEMSWNHYFVYATVIQNSGDEILRDCYDSYGYKGGYYSLEYRCPGDEEIEDQMKQLYTPFMDGRAWLDIDSEPWKNGSGLEYRTEECTSISIRSTSPLFGRPAESEISDQFVFDPNFGERVTFPFKACLISYDKKVLGLLDGCMSVDEYLSYRPMVLPYFNFKLVDAPVELIERGSLETDFIVEIGLGNGKQLKDTTHVKLLMPEDVADR